MSADSHRPYPTADEGFTLISTQPEGDQTHAPARSDQPQPVDIGRPRRPSSVPPIARITRPALLILVAILDVLTNHAFFFLLFLPSASSDSPEPRRRAQTSILRLLLLGYIRCIFILILALRKNWTAGGRLCMTLAFVITGLAVLWEINLSVLYRGWGDKVVALFAREGKGKVAYLFLQMMFASLEYIAYALSLHWATRQGRHLSPTQARTRQRATSIRFEEEDVFLDRPVGRNVISTSADGYLAPRPPAATSQHDESIDQEEDHYSDSSREVDDDEHNSEDEDDEDLSPSDREDDSSDEDEIIDLPIPAEARIERKASQLSLRRRRRVDRDRKVSPSRAHQANVGNDEGGGVWESVRGVLGLSRGLQGRRQSPRDGYGTI